MKPTIVLIHGWGGSIKSLENLDISLQKKGYSTLRLEIPGFGSTPEMNKPWNMNDFSKWLKEKTSHLDKFVLVGHSFGGRIIIHSVINKQLKPQKIVLIDISGIKPKNTLKKKFWKNVSKVAKKFEKFPFYNFVRKVIYTKIINERDYLKAQGNLKETFKIINESFYDNEVSKINLPTLIIWGDEDKATPLWMGEYLQENILNSKLVVIKGGHNLPLVKYEQIAEIIDNFLKN
ncbi:MAG: alpha/beta hydrolase [Candidatus Dojkabacteria bacterium]|nr:MAG: alpha/beta hydrolase [Candidatus Dojkabacteria bacterium]